MAEDIIPDKAMLFATNIVATYRKLTAQKEYILSKQLLRSGTSIGANLAEAAAAISKPDFLAKSYIALKEAKETEYWLNLLYNSEILDKDQFLKMQFACQELCRLLTARCKTTAKNINLKP